MASVIPADSAIAIPSAAPSRSISRRAINQGLRVKDFFVAIYRYREYLKQSVARDLRKKYKRSVLGYVWSMLNPLLMMSILTIVFANLMHKSMDSYAVFLFSAMLPWQYFAHTINDSLGAIRSNMNIISQVPVPKYLFVLSNAFSNLTNLLLSLVPLMLVMLALGHPFHATILFLPAVLLPLFIFTMAVSILFSVSNVFFEDTRHLTSVILQGLYFLLPVLFAREHLPEWLVHWLVLNPLFSLIEFSRQVVHEGVMPDMRVYCIVFGGSVLALAFALWVFNKADNKFHYYV